MKAYLVICVLFSIIHRFGFVLGDINDQKAAVKAWVKSLSEEDYESDKWNKFGKQPQNYFDMYVSKLSDIFLKNNAIVNFVLTGMLFAEHDFLLPVIRCL